MLRQFHPGKKYASSQTTEVAHNSLQRHRLGIPVHLIDYYENVAMSCGGHGKGPYSIYANPFKQHCDYRQQLQWPCPWGHRVEPVGTSGRRCNIAALGHRHLASNMQLDARLIGHHGLSVVPILVVGRTPLVVSPPHLCSTATLLPLQSKDPSGPTRGGGEPVRSTRPRGSREGPLGF